MFRTTLILALAAVTFSTTGSLSTASPKENTKSERVSKMMDPPTNENSTMMIMNAMAECNETYKIDSSFTKALDESGSFPDETERNPKCFVRCVMETLGVATSDGVYDLSAMPAFMEVLRMNSPNKGSFKDITEQCNDRKETCKCEKAYQYVKCLIQTDIKNNGAS